MLIRTSGEGQDRFDIINISNILAQRDRQSLILQNLMFAMAGDTKGALTASGFSQYFLISGRALKRLRSSFRKGSLAQRAGQTCSMQQAISTSKKSTKVRQPSSHSLLPLNLQSWVILGLIFSKRLSFSSSPLGVQMILRRLSSTSLRTPSMLRIVALSLRSFPNSSFLLERSITQLMIDLVSVIFTLLSIRYGKLGKSKPKLYLSPPNHCAGLVYLTSSQSAPVQVSSSRITCALPLSPQYPKVVFPQLILSLYAGYSNILKYIVRNQKTQTYNESISSLLAFYFLMEASKLGEIYTFSTGINWNVRQVIIEDKSRNDQFSY